MQIRLRLTAPSIKGFTQILWSLIKSGLPRPMTSVRNLTAYGGLLPVATMLEKLGFQQLVEESLTVKRQTRSIPIFGFILGMILACYVGFSRLHHLRFLKREPMLTSILRVAELPPQCTFWRFLASLHLGVARQLLTVQWRMRERVWAAAQRSTGRNHRGHRHHGAHAVRQAAGRAQGL